MKNKFKKSVFLLSSLMMLSVGAGIISGVDSHVDTVEAEDMSATLTFDNTSKRTVATTEQQVWVENDITFTNNKGASTSNVNTSYYNPIRCYASSNAVISYTKFIKKIEFVSTSGASDLVNSIGSNASLSGTTVSVTLDGKAKEFTITKFTKQVRLSSLTVFYDDSTSGGEGGGTTTTYAVSFDTDGGEEIAAFTNITSETSITLPTPTKEGNTFNGWYLGEDKVGDAGESYIVTGNVTLKASWTPNSSGDASKEFVPTDFCEGEIFITTKSKSGNKVYLPAATNTSSAPVAESFNDVSEIGEENLWTVTATTGGYHIKNSEGSYLYCTNTNNGVRIGDTEHVWEYNIGDNYFKSSTLTRYLGIFADQDWRCYNTVTANNYKNNDETYSSKSFVFYKEKSDAIEYTVTFDSNGGSEVLSKSVKANETCAEPEIPTKEMHEFICWTYNGEEFDFNTPITDHITLVATWKRISESAKENYKLSSIADASSLKIGDKIVIGANTDDGTYLMGGQKSNNRDSVLKDISTSFIDENVQFITLEAGSQEGTFAFNTGDGYLYAAGTGDNYLRTRDEIGVDGNADWLITFENNEFKIVANGDKENNTMRFNKASNSLLFAAYKEVEKEDGTYSITGISVSLFKVSSSIINYQYDSNNIDEMNAIRFISSIKDVNTDEINSIKLTFTLDGVAADDIEITKVYRSVTSTQGNFESVDGTYYVVYAISGLTKTLHEKELVVKMTVEFNDSTTLIASRSIILGA